MDDNNRSPFVGHPRVLNNLVGTSVHDPPDHLHVLTDPYTCLPGAMQRRTYRPKPELPQVEPDESEQPESVSSTPKSEVEDQEIQEDPQPRSHIAELKGNNVYPLPFVPDPNYHLMKQLSAVADAIEDPNTSWSDKANWGAPTKLGRMNVAKFKPIEKEKGLSDIEVDQEIDEDTSPTPSVKALTKVLSEEELKNIMEETVHKPVLENVLDAGYVQYLDDAILGGETFFMPMEEYMPGSTGLMAPNPTSAKDQSNGSQKPINSYAGLMAPNPTSTKPPMPPPKPTKGNIEGTNVANGPPLPPPRRKHQVPPQTDLPKPELRRKGPRSTTPRPRGGVFHEQIGELEAASLANRPPMPLPKTKDQMDDDDPIYYTAGEQFPRPTTVADIEAAQLAKRAPMPAPRGTAHAYPPVDQSSMDPQESGVYLSIQPEGQCNAIPGDSSKRPGKPLPRTEDEDEDTIYSEPYEHLPDRILNKPQSSSDPREIVGYLHEQPEVQCNAIPGDLSKRPSMPLPLTEDEDEDTIYSEPYEHLPARFLNKPQFPPQGRPGMRCKRAQQSETYRTPVDQISSSRSQASSTYETPVHFDSGSGPYSDQSMTFDTVDSGLYDDSQTNEEPEPEIPEMPWSKADPGYEKYIEKEEVVEPIESSDEEPDIGEHETLKKANMNSYEDYYAKFNDTEKPKDRTKTIDGVEKIIRTKTPWSSVIRRGGQPYSLQMYEGPQAKVSDTSTEIAMEDYPKCMCFNLDHEKCWKKVEKDYDSQPCFRDDLLNKTDSKLSQKEKPEGKGTCSWLSCIDGYDSDEEPTPSNSSMKKKGKKSASKTSNPQDDRNVKESSSRTSTPQDDRKAGKSSSSKISGSKVVESSSSRISNPQEDRKADKSSSSKMSGSKVAESSSSKISNPQDNRLASDSSKKIESKLSGNSDVTDEGLEKHTCMGCSFFPCKTCRRPSLVEIEVEDVDLEVEPSEEILMESEREQESEPESTPPRQFTPPPPCEILSAEVLPEIPGPDVEFEKVIYKAQEIDLDCYEKIQTPYLHDDEYLEYCYWTRCRYCNMNFSDSQPPILLKCWHLICEFCYQFITENMNEDDFFACPECSEPHKVYPRGIPIAYRIQFPLRMLEYNEKVKDLEDVPLCDLSDTKEPEGREEHELVKWLCGDCHRQLCNACMMVHYENTKHSYVSFKQCHEAFIRKSITKKMYFCIDHPKESLEKFCLDCSMLACKECATSSHNNHTISSLDEFIQPQRNSVAYTLGHAYPAAIRMIDKCLLHLRARQSSLAYQFAQINSFISSKADQARNMIDQLARILCGDLIRKVGTVAQENEDHIIECYAEYANLMQMKNLIQTVLDYASDEEMPHLAILFEKFYNNLFDYQTALPKACYMFTMEVECTGAEMVDFGLEIGPTKLKHCINVFDSPIESIAMHGEVMILVSPILQGIERSKVRVLCSDFTQFKDLGNLIKQQAPCVSRVCYANIDGTIYLVLLNRGECSNIKGELMNYNRKPGCNNGRYYIKLIEVDKGDIKEIKREVGFSPVAIANQCKFGLAYTTNRFDTFDAALVVQNPHGPPCPVFTNENNPEKDFVQPEYMCCNSNGDFIVTDKQTHRLFIISCQGDIINVVNFDFPDALSTPDFPNGVCVDANDNIYVAISNDNIIERYTPDGSESEVFLDRLDGIEQPQSILIQDELLYVGTRTGKLLIYSIR